MQRRRESEGTTMGPIGPTSFGDALLAFKYVMIMIVMMIMLMIYVYVVMIMMLKLTEEFSSDHHRVRTSRTKLLQFQTFSSDS